jgi:hypothetical protein
MINDLGTTLTLRVTGREIWAVVLVCLSFGAAG